ncbi:MAG: FAD-dependent oxidoreductase, partial [Clostridiales bacterium]|nr:FAD-dependent oxidoreductase [Clostridiales bacterium]
MAATKKIVIVGGGYAGVLTAKHLAKRIKKGKLQKEVEVTLIDKNPFHTMLTELHEVAAGRVEEASIRMDLKEIFAGRAVDVVLDRIDGIDFEGRTLTGREKTYAYDYLVLGAGSKPAFWGVEGAAENAFSLWSFEDAVRLKEHLLALFRKAAPETDAAARRAMLTFFVVGGGFTGVEMIGELAEWIPFLCAEYRVARADVSLFLVDALDRILPSLPEKRTAKVIGRLHKMGVTVRT